MVYSSVGCSLKNDMYVWEKEVSGFLLQSFFSGYTHWLCREDNYCVFACTEWRRECTTALHMSETMLSDSRYMHRLQFYCHATVSDDFFFLLSHQKHSIGLPPLANGFSYFAQQYTLLKLVRCHSISHFLISHFSFLISHSYF